MNTLLEAPAHEAETVERRHDDVGVARKACRISRDQGRSDLHWLKATVRTIDSRSDALDQKHWKKVWRSMVEN